MRERRARLESEEEGGESRSPVGDGSGPEWSGLGGRERLWCGSYVGCHGNRDRLLQTRHAGIAAAPRDEPPTRQAARVLREPPASEPGNHTHDEMLKPLECIGWESFGKEVRQIRFRRHECNTQLTFFDAVTYLEVPAVQVPR